MINLIKLTLRINRLEFLVVLQTLLAKFFCFHTLIDKGASTTYLDAAWSLMFSPLIHRWSQFQFMPMQRDMWWQ